MSGIGNFLAGIVVNNNIALIDTFDRLVKRQDAKEAILMTEHKIKTFLQQQLQQCWFNAYGAKIKY